MKSKKQIKTTIESHERWVISRPAQEVSVLCGVCANRTVMLRAEEAARLTGVSLRVICQWVEAGRIHYIETPEDGLLVCLAPLALDTD